VRSDENLSDRR